MDSADDQFDELDWTESPATVGFDGQGVSDGQGPVILYKFINYAL